MAGNDGAPGCCASSMGVAGLREVCYREKGSRDGQVRSESRACGGRPAGLAGRFLDIRKDFHKVLDGLIHEYEQAA